MCSPIYFVVIVLHMVAGNDTLRCYWYTPNTYVRYTMHVILCIVNNNLEVNWEAIHLSVYTYTVVVILKKQQ